jgi:hypothetical protein
MKTEKDCAELLKLLNRNRVKYCIVGAYAEGKKEKQLFYGLVAKRQGNGLQNRYSPVRIRPRPLPVLCKLSIFDNVSLYDMQGE